MSQFVVEVRREITNLQDDMLSVSICLPAFLPLDRDASLYHGLRELEETVKSCHSSFVGVDNYQVINGDIFENISNFIQNAYIYINAAKMPNLMSLHEEYNELVINSYDTTEHEILMFMKVKIYDVFIENIKICFGAVQAN